MAVSDSTDFELDVAEYIEEAFERCGLEVRTGYDLKSAKRSLNLMLAEWANRGINLWTVKKQEKALAANTTSLTGTNLFGANADDSQQIVGITDVIIRDSSNNDYSTNTISRAQYWNYTVKTTSGRPTQYYFERTINPTLFCLLYTSDAADE